MHACRTHSEGVVFACFSSVTKLMTKKPQGQGIRVVRPGSGNPGSRLVGLLCFASSLAFANACADRGRRSDLGPGEHRSHVNCWRQSRRLLPSIILSPYPTRSRTHFTGASLGLRIDQDEVCLRLLTCPRTRRGPLERHCPCRCICKCCRTAAGSPENPGDPVDRGSPSARWPELV